MATWSDLRTQLLSNYDTDEASSRLLSVTLTYPDGHTRVTYVSSAEDHEDRLWVSIDSVVARADQADLLRAVRLAGDGLCGGIATMPIRGVEYLVLRHAIPFYLLEDGQMNDFLVPFFALTGSAERVEQELSTFNPL